MAAACAAGVTTSHAAGNRQLCRLPDGEQHVVQQQLAQSFGLSMSDCTAMPPGLAVPEPDVTPVADASWSRPVDAGIRVTVIRAAIPRPAASWTPVEYQHLIARSARSHGVDPQVVEAVIYVESHFEPNAQSTKGALGLMQLMPQTALQCGVRSRSSLFDPATNIECGTRYFGELTDYFAGRIDLALAAYNAGPGAVVRHGWRVPPFAETRAYVDRVLQRLNATR